ncbi:hypothetical protein QU481_12860 [Crenobacter sp. SG2303]|uniref:Uncharacterized protein n=1 Tax=Crenobacter oryzisoli TaxID=3056844 RepID=A0ABT7XPT1_9NEIS|nr:MULTISPECIES: hypothetical protein [unclassified Crenobacter]MDN0075776.1 hypothetical protein [Crenobacter sp. SG2303]MDN0082705.1 hypothetical protein [Crenobacter sp. SG2305]
MNKLFAAIIISMATSLSLAQGSIKIGKVESMRDSTFFSVQIITDRDDYQNPGFGLTKCSFDGEVINSNAAQYQARGHTKEKALFSDKLYSYEIFFSITKYDQIIPSGDKIAYENLLSYLKDKVTLTCNIYKTSFFSPPKVIGKFSVPMKLIR